MEVQELWISKRNDGTTKLFRTLFQLNLELEKLSRSNSNFEPEVKVVIEAVDRCLETILQKANTRKT